MFKTRSVLSAALILSAAFAGSASAQVRTWDFGDTSTPGACTGTYQVFANTIGCTQQPNGIVVNLNVTAFSTTGTSGTTYETAAVNAHGTGSGMGVANRSEGALVSGSPDHSMDNSGTGADMLLLSFTGIGDQILKSVKIGWSGTDGDFQVLRWGGTGVASSITGRTAAQLLTDGWLLTGTVDGQGGINTSPADVTYGVNNTNAASSYWLISAFNSSFGAGGSSGIDALKVLGVTTGVAVPTPGTLALAGLAMIGLVGSRRRNAR